MPAAKQYVNLDDFDMRVDEETGESKRFRAGETYDGPPEKVQELLSDLHRPGGLIAAKSSDEARSAVAESKDADAKPEGN